jgi:hypothetical protein
MESGKIMKLQKIMKFNEFMKFRIRSTSIDVHESRVIHDCNFSVLLRRILLSSVSSSTGMSVCIRPGCGAASSSKCGRCKSVSYCSRSCQNQHWTAHKHACSPQAAATSAAPSKGHAAHARPRVEASSMPPAFREFTYIPSADGKDTNLLVFLPGVGDSHRNFAAFARSLNLPQSASLVLQGPFPLPFDDMDGGMWYPWFEPDGECASLRFLF